MFQAEERRYAKLHFRSGVAGMWSLWWECEKSRIKGKNVYKSDCKMWALL